MGNNSVAHRVFHLDNGRKYFTKDWIIALSKELAAAGYNELQLSIANDGLRFLLDDMAVGSYSSEQVTKAVEAGNISYSTKKNTESDSLTQSEMDEIIAAANAHGVQIVPLFNTPGHMYTVITAMTELGINNPGYHESTGSVDFENPEAVAFTKGLITKYIRYFAEKGCKYFCIGADEYANDCYLNYPGMGFGKLSDTGKYDSFIAYINELADIVAAAGMTPRAFNDGIYYNSNTSVSINKNIQVCYWSAGWNGYNLAPADVIAAQGHEMINTDGKYYYILGKEDIFDKDGAKAAEDFTNSAFPNVTIENPAGAMFCIWSDSPDDETEQQTAARSRQVLRVLGGRLNGEEVTAETVNKKDIPGGFHADGSINE